MNLNINYSGIWGKDALAKGYFQVPNLLSRNLGKFGITTTEFSVVILIMSHKKGTHIAASTIARSLDISVHTVRNSIRNLVELKYVHRIYHQGDANTFSCGGIINAVEVYAKTGQTPTQISVSGIANNSPDPSHILYTNKEEDTKKNKKGRDSPEWQEARKKFKRPKAKENG